MSVRSNRKNAVRVTWQAKTDSRPTHITAPIGTDTDNQKETRFRFEMLVLYDGSCQIDFNRSTIMSYGELPPHSHAAGIMRKADFLEFGKAFLDIYNQLKSSEPK